MPQNNRLPGQVVDEYSIFNSTSVNKGRLDLIVLRYMAHKVAQALASMEDTSNNTPLPALSYAEEQRNRLHRIAIYNPLALKRLSSIAFVGFVSKKQQPLSTAIVEDIHEIDRKLIADLIGTPGMLSYSSLELRTGRWYNLVLFSDAATKEHIKNSQTHKYAAYQLAPRYYQWIRLHNGSLPQGLARCNLVLQKTKLYTFQGLTAHPTVREQSYENITLQDTAVHSTIHTLAVG